MTLAQRHRELRQADAGPVPQQDPRGPALRRAQELLPAQRGRVLHLVLRLLPARSVRPDDRHVHREGRVDQRGHRAPAAARHVEPDGARGRRHRRHGERDLRPGRSGRVSRADGHADAGASSVGRDDILRALVRIQYGRNDVAFEQGTFRVRGDTVEIFPAYEEQAIRVELWGDEVERISQDQPAHRRDDRRARAVRRSIRRSTSSPSAPTIERAVQAHPRRARRAARRAARRRASCSRRSGSSRAPTSTSR